MFGILTLNKFVALFIFPSVVILILRIFYFVKTSKDDRKEIKITGKSAIKGYRKQKKVRYILFRIFPFVLIFFSGWYALGFISEYVRLAGIIRDRSLAHGYATNSLTGMILAGILEVLFYVSLSRGFVKNTSVLKRHLQGITIVYAIGLICKIISFLIFMKLKVYV